MSKIKKNWEKKKVTEKIDKLLTGFDDGELFVEEVFSENIVFDDNKIKTSSFDQDKGFGLRAVKQEELKFYHSSNLCDDSLNKAIKYVSSFDSKKKILSANTISKKTNRLLYSDNNPINLVPLNKKIGFLKKINKYARSLDSSIKQVSISLNGNFQNIEVTKKDGAFFYDSRPLVRMNINLSI